MATNQCCVLLRAYLIGELDALSAKRFEGHLAGCAECAQETAAARAAGDQETANSAPAEPACFPA